MALPIIPIIMAVAALGSGIVQGISSVKNAKSEAKAIQETTKAQIEERQRAAKKLMQEQKTSFLKSGVYFNSGSPLEVINETYDYSLKDINAMIKDTNAQTKNLERQGKTAFFSSILEGIANGAMSFFGAGGASGLASKAGSAISNSKAGTAFTNWYNGLRGWNTGGFGQLPTSNGLPSGNTTKIV